MNFTQIYTQVAQNIQDTSAGRETRIKDAINRQYQYRTEAFDWAELVRIRPAEITTVGGDALVFLPKYVDVAKQLISDVDTTLLKGFGGPTFYARNFEVLGTNGNPREFTPVGTSAVKRMIASAETLDVVSSDTNDTTVNIEIWGLVSGEEINETVALNGTTTVPTTNSFSRITKIGTSSTSANSERIGTVTISGTTSSVEYATLAPQDVDSRYQVLQLESQPNAGSTLSLIYKKKVVLLENDGDSLEVPIGPALVQLAIADILQQQHKWGPAREHKNEGEKMLLMYQSKLKIQSTAIEQAVPAFREGQSAVIVVNNG